MICSDITSRALLGIIGREGLSPSGANMLRSAGLAPPGGPTAGGLGRMPLVPIGRGPGPRGRPAILGPAGLMAAAAPIFGRGPSGRGGALPGAVAPSPDRPPRPAAKPRPRALAPGPLPCRPGEGGLPGLMRAARPSGAIPPDALAGGTVLGPVCKTSRVVGMLPSYIAAA